MCVWASPWDTVVLLPCNIPSPEFFLLGNVKSENAFSMMWYLCTCNAMSCAMHQCANNQSLILQLLSYCISGTTGCYDFCSTNACKRLKLA